MNPIKYAMEPDNRNGMMSLCHIWFGVLRSKNRGFEGLRRGFFLAFTISDSFVKTRRTVSGDACIQKKRFNACAIRFTPWTGCSCFNATIRSRTGPGSLGFRGPPGAFACKPASPSSRYRKSHL